MLSACSLYAPRIIALFFKPDLIFPSSPASHPEKKTSQHQKKHKIATMTEPPPPHRAHPVAHPLRSPMLKLISQIPPPLPPFVSTKRQLQICLVDCMVLPQTRDHRFRGRNPDILPQGKSTGTRLAVLLLLRHVSRFRRPSQPN